MCVWAVGTDTDVFPRQAFLRTQYPETFWGAISSSGVTVAIADYWEYNEPVRQYGPTDCVSVTQDVVELLDHFLLPRAEDEGHPGLRHNKTAAIQELFGLGEILNPADFASAIYIAGIGTWQGRNWDPRVSVPDFG